MQTQAVGAQHPAAVQATGWGAPENGRGGEATWPAAPRLSSAQRAMAAAWAAGYARWAAFQRECRELWEAGVRAYGGSAPRRRRAA